MHVGKNFTNNEFQGDLLLQTLLEDLYYFLVYFMTFALKFYYSLDECHKCEIFLSYIINFLFVQYNEDVFGISKVVSLHFENYLTDIVMPM